MVTKSYYRLIMGKEEIDFFCLIWDIWIFFIQKCLLSSFLRFIRLLAKSVNLIGCRCCKKGQFMLKKLKSTDKGYEAETCHTCL